MLERFGPFVESYLRKKKPDPEIYTLALKKTGLSPNECIVIEDSRNGVKAAKAAGLFVVATTNFFTQNEDLSEADIVVSCLGDPDGEKSEVIKSSEGLEFTGFLSASELVNHFSS